MSNEHEKKMTATQLITILTIEAQVAQLQIAANQLGGFLGLKREADVCMDGIATLQRGLGELKKSWDQKIQLLGPHERIINPVIPSVAP